MFNIKSLLMEAFEELDKLNEAGSSTTITEATEEDP
jgi:hypothetical protein